jgi:5'-3' exonuclease
MGIKDFYKYVKLRWPDCFEPVSYTALRYQRIALDMMNILYVFRARDERTWMRAVIWFLVRLRNQCVHPVCVFDGSHTHPLKQSTVDKRREEREKGRQRAGALDQSLRNYESTGICDTFLTAFLASHADCVSALTQKPIVGAIRDHVQRLTRAYNLSFSASEVAGMQQLLRALGFCVLQAEYDGEALCAYLSANGLVENVLSNDSDVFFFGATRVLFRFTDEGAYQIDTVRLLNAMGLTREQFINLCLLCGTDFNVSVRGVGFCRAYAMVQQYPRLDDPSFPYVLDHSRLNEIRLFTDISSGSSFAHQVHYCRPVQASEELHRLLFQYQIDLPLADLLHWTYSSVEIDDCPIECI